MLKPIARSRRDIVSKGVANLVGASCSAAEMVRWLGEGQLGAFADQLLRAMENLTGSKEMGGSADRKGVYRGFLSEEIIHLPCFTPVLYSRCRIG